MQVPPGAAGQAILPRLTDLQDKLRNLSEASLRAGTDEDLAAIFEQNYRLDVPVLDRDPDHALLASAEVSIDVTDDPGRDSRGRRIYEKGTQFVLKVPFEGNGEHFWLSGGLPQNARIDEHFIYLTQDLRQADGGLVRRQFDAWLDGLDAALGALRLAVQSWNTVDMPREVREGIARRRKKLDQDDAVAQAVGYPLKRNANATTYTVPVQRKRLTTIGDAPPLTPPQVTGHVLGLDAYEEVLRLLANMAIAVERSPSVFVGAEEEDFRDFMLVMLNAVFEGQATGETFNRGGKTDILVRVEGRNVFVGECKIWSGPKTLDDALDQLLSYSCWRDPRLAIVLFSRNKNFQGVVDQIAPAVKGHRAYIRAVPVERSEATFRFEIKHPEHGRPMVLTVIAFDVSAVSPKGGSAGPTVSIPNL